MSFHLLQEAQLIQNLADVQGKHIPPSAQAEPAWEQSNSHQLGQQDWRVGRRFGTGHFSIPNISFPMTVFKPPEKAALPHLDV